MIQSDNNAPMTDSDENDDDSSSYNDDDHDDENDGDDNISLLITLTYSPKDCIIQWGHHKQ